MKPCCKQSKLIGKKTIQFKIYLCSTCGKLHIKKKTISDKKLIETRKKLLKLLKKESGKQ